MSTGTGNNREIFSLYSVSQISWVLFEAEAPFLLKGENRSFCLGSCFVVFFFFSQRDFGVF